MTSLRVSFMLLTLLASSVGALKRHSCAKVANFTLIDAATRRDIGALPRTIFLRDYPATAKFNIRVDIDDSQCKKAVESVRLEYKYNGTIERTFCEEYLPYTVFGDNNVNRSDINDNPKARYFRYRFPIATAANNASIRVVAFFQNGCKENNHGSGQVVTERRFWIVSATKAFETTQELYDAVDRWVAGATTPDTDLARTYGYPIGQWDVSKLTAFNHLFYPSRNYDAARDFGDDISMWNVSSATNMSYMFSNTQNFYSNLSRWDVSNVVDMEGMFSDFSDLFRLDISNWDVSNVKNMRFMFSQNYGMFTDLSKWDVSNVLDMSNMFQFSQNLQGDISKWDVSRVTNMNSMFATTKFRAPPYDSTELFNTDFSAWNVSSVQDIRSMFSWSDFDKNLCAWGAKLPSTAKTNGAFVASRCPERGRPDLSATPPGPFCFACE